jgi:flagellar hook-associated protein 1 FlgK
MPSMSSLNIGVSGLLANRRALDTTGHNIANVDTPGFARQRAVVRSELPQIRAEGIVGRGVRVETVEHIVNDFIEERLRDTTSLAREYVELMRTYDEIEVQFNELSEQDLSTTLDRFFSSLHDLANNAEDESTRGAVVQEALSLRDQFVEMRGAMEELRARLDENVASSVEEINEILRSIAQLNAEIAISEKGGATNLHANDLRDQRTLLLRDLAEFMAVDVFEQPNGVLNVTVNGRPLVLYDRVMPLAWRWATAPDGRPVREVIFEDGSGLTPTEGRLRAMMEARDTILPSFQADLDELAGTLVFAFNRVHSTGVGLQAYSTVTGTNRVLDKLATLDQMDLGFTPPPGTFQVQNGSFVINLRNETTGQITQVRIDVDLDGVGTDTTLDDPIGGTGLVQAINAAVPAGTVVASTDLQGHLVVQAAGPNTTFWFTEDTSGVLATLGIAGFFVGHDAATIDVAPVILAEDFRIATGRTLVPGDNTNILDLTGVRDLPVFGGGTRTLDDAYQAIIGRLGVEAARARDRGAVAEDLERQIENEREALSGVSLDEEVAHMIAFQRGFQASARFIVVVDELLEAILTMV